MNIRKITCILLISTSLTLCKSVDETTPHTYITKEEMLDILKKYERVKEKQTFIPSNDGYPYLDNDYRIIVDSKTFDSIVIANHFKREKLRPLYRDSLAVILSDRYQGNKNLERSVYMRITSNGEYWRHFFLADLDAYKELENHLNVTFNGDTYDYFRDQTIKSSIKDDILELVKKRVVLFYQNDTVKVFEDSYGAKTALSDTTYSTLLRTAFHARKLPTFYDARDSINSSKKGDCEHGLGDNCIHNKSSR